MKKCFSCGHENAPDAKFCSQCGRDFSGGRAPRTDSQGRRATPSPDPRVGYPHGESLQQWREMRGRKLKWALICAGGCILVAAGAAYAMQSPIVFAVGLVLALVLAYQLVQIRESDYYALPYALLGGEHRCIFCGARGIWRRTPYRTNSTICACPSCKEDLYIE